MSEKASEETGKYRAHFSRVSLVWRFPMLEARSGIIPEISNRICKCSVLADFELDAGIGNKIHINQA